MARPKNCSCGNEYLPDSDFCRLCGTKRPNAIAMEDEGGAIQEQGDRGRVHVFPHGSLQRQINKSQSRASSPGIRKERGAPAEAAPSVAYTDSFCHESLCRLFAMAGLLGLLLYWFLSSDELPSEIPDWHLKDHAREIFSELKAAAAPAAAFVARRSHDAHDLFPSSEPSQRGLVSLPEECLKFGEEYTAVACSTEVRNEWGRRASLPPPADACSVDFSTGKISCDTDISCEGGFSRFVEDVRVKHNMEYDCSKCHDMQKTSCCVKCLELQRKASAKSLSVGGEAISDVECRHCEESELQHIEPQPAVSCSHNTHDGTFRCSVSEHCSHGRLKQNVLNHSFSCLITPCDTCTDQVARAHCCSMCLDNFCHAQLGSSDRWVCKGCNADGY